MLVKQEAGSPKVRRVEGAGALIATALLMGGCGGGGDGGSSPIFVPVPVAIAADAQPRTVTERMDPAPFAPPVPLPDVGPQFKDSPTGTPYPKLATLYPGHNGPTVDDGMILPWLSNKPRLKFKVMVQTSLDTDSDGKPDRIALRVVQPAEVAEGLKTPVIVRPSIYYENPGYANSRAPFLGEDQYIRMGYTIVYADSLGSNDSDGCASIMDDAERQAMADVVRWLTKDSSAKGVDDKGGEIFASWSTGHVAMEGVSYGGTLPIMAAATGVTGLEAIVPVDGISNAYDYFQRYNGVNPADTVGLISYATDPVSSWLSPSRPSIIARNAKCRAHLNKMAADIDDVTLAYNAFWKKRNTLALADNIKAATLIAHGQSDNNVKSKNSVQLYETLYRLKKPVQLWLHSRDHDDPAWQKEWQKQILLWYSRYLFGVNNGVEKQPSYVRETPAGDRIAGDLASSARTDTSDTLIGHCSAAAHSPRDCIPSGELLVKEEAWPATNTSAYYLHASSSVPAGLLLTPDPAQGTAGKLIVFKASGKSGVFETQPLVNATRFAGTVRLEMTARFLAKAANLKAVLFVDGKRVTWGWANPRFHQGLEKETAIRLDTDYKLSLEMMPRDFTVLPGSKIAVQIEGYNKDASIGAAQQIGIDLAQTTLQMPVVPRASPAAVMKLD